MNMELHGPSPLSSEEEKESLKTGGLGRVTR